MAERALHIAAAATWRLEVNGQVQGVGYRPFVYRLATQLGICGEVRNALGTVRIVAQGPVTALEEFAHRLSGDAPVLARATVRHSEFPHCPYFSDFRIQASVPGEGPRVCVPPDYFLCDDCCAEQSDPMDRRYRYPFINCTQCGPRYTLIRSLPYDRPNTSMDAFSMCPDCASEYVDPANRRFHAEPIACPVCGPRLSFAKSGDSVSHEKEAALRATLEQLKAGRVVAVKGIGGYHLLCDASSPQAVARLRRHKMRPDKPLAVMFPLAGVDGLAALRQQLNLSVAEAERLLSPARPIVLLGKREDSDLADGIAPGLGEVGAFLPYSPLHQLLLDGYGAPLVATSGNLSGEPVLTDNATASTRLARIADAFLHHDRPIVRPADDPVYREIAGAMRPLRLGRGVAPLELNLPWRQTEPVLCVGGHMKATVTLSWEDRAVVSPHIGEMDSPRSQSVFAQLAADLQTLYGVTAKRVICDAHPGYASHRWAREQSGLPYAAIWHHRAHASALVSEIATPGPWLVFAWDGVGLGEDRTLWGGEALLGDAGRWQRICSFRPFSPPGGDRAGREPWRSAAALAWAVDADLPWREFDVALARRAWQKGVNCPQTSAVGRLFDAAAAYICDTRRVSYEAQGPMLLETLVRKAGEHTSLPLYADDGVLRSDWAPLFAGLADSRRSPCERAENFHSSMALVIVDQARAVRERHAIRQVGLTGGVFQNRALTEQAVDLLTAAGFDVHLSQRLPANDAALSFGQAAEWAARCQQKSN